MAITDVPVCPLDPFGTGSTKAGTLTALLLQALQSDGTETGIRSVDAVGIEFGLFHIRKIGWIGGEVNRLGTVPRLSHAVEHFGNRLLILLIGCEAVPISGGNLTDGSVDRIATLLDHLQAVGVCLFHEPIIGTGSAGLGSTLCQSLHWFQKA